MDVSVCMRAWATRARACDSPLATLESLGAVMHIIIACIIRSACSHVILICFENKVDAEIPDERLPLFEIPF